MMNDDDDPIDLNRLDDEYDPDFDHGGGFRRLVYAVLIISAFSYFTVRVSRVIARDKQTPFLSANDRSRWAGVEALLSERTFAIDNVIEKKGWNTIDKVSHFGRDGRQHYYSSKPPLLYLLLTGETWAVERMVGYRLSYKPFLVGRIVVWITNGALLLSFFFVVCRSVERWGRSDWGRIFVVAVATWGTFLSPFAVSINNHLPGVVAVAFSFYQLLRIWYGDREEEDGSDDDEAGQNEAEGWRYAVCGFAAACTVVCELPALAFLVGVMGALMIKSPRKTLAYAAPLVLLVAVAFIGTNVVAHGTLKFPYMHRTAGEDWTGDNWYNYEGSYWLNPQSVDVGEPSVLRYGFHVIVGHHGILSLTPVWLLSLYGTYLVVVKRKHYATALAIVGLTAMCLVFFIVLRPTRDRNYGGSTCGFRWMFWLIPIWLVAMIPAADRVMRMPKMRWLAIAALLISVFSACYHGMNPWTHPWIYQLFNS